MYYHWFFCQGQKAQAFNLVVFYFLGVSSVLLPLFACCQVAPEILYVCKLDFLMSGCSVMMMYHAGQQKYAEDTCAAPWPHQIRRHSHGLLLIRPCIASNQAVSLH